MAPPLESKNTIQLMRYFNGSGIVFVDPHTAPGKLQKLNISESSVAHAYHVWLTSVTAIVSYPAQTE